ncbi:DNA polymerase III subunit delta' [Magnetococcus sp. PR-3]|uniref:DNA polymerase III subunit delta' n=1 Tax=Magnetococcus sp. PR-3 TaxID=3120355 RepID=UPI002FCE0A43
MLQFNQILGQQGALDGLTSAIAAGRLAHGLLFYGPAGVGKKSTVRALVQRTLCHEVGEHALNASGTLPESGCGHCSSCARFDSGGHPDLLWLEKQDGRTQLLVDQVRDLTHFVALTPLLSNYKVAVIDEVSLMNASAANALLKTLEEPPAQSLIILTTQSPGALLPTIRSRCQAIRFVPLEADILRKLLKNHKTEPPLTDQAMESAIEMAGGSMGRALALCEGELPTQRQELWQDMAQLLKGTDLGTICDLAARWGKAELFETTTMLLEFWFQSHIRANLLDQDQSNNHQAQSTRNREWLTLAQQFTRMVDEARVFNLNRPLMLEHLFIRITRLAT